jgi:hypothetical protein
MGDLHERPAQKICKYNAWRDTTEAVEMAQLPPRNPSLINIQWDTSGQKRYSGERAKFPKKQDETVQLFMN